VPILSIGANHPEELPYKNMIKRTRVLVTNFEKRITEIRVWTNSTLKASLGQNSSLTAEGTTITLFKGESPGNVCNEYLTIIIRRRRSEYLAIIE